MFQVPHIAAILCNYIQSILASLRLSHHNYTLMVVNVGCPVYLVALPVGCQGGSVLKVDLAGLVNKKRFTSCF